MDTAFHVLSIRIHDFPQCACNLLNAVRTEEFRESRGTAFVKGTTRGKQNRQCTYNVTLKCVRVTIVAVEKQ